MYGQNNYNYRWSEDEDGINWRWCPDRNRLVRQGWISDRVVCPDFEPCPVVNKIWSVEYVC